MVKDSGGWLARYGPGTQDAQRPDGQWVRVFFDLPISERRAAKVRAFLAAGNELPKGFRGRVIEVEPPYEFPDRYEFVRWQPISGAPVGELPGGASEQYLVKYGETVEYATYRHHWLHGWRWENAKRKSIKPEWFTPLLP